jgi:hypothetical protein
LPTALLGVQPSDRRPEMRKAEGTD